QRRISPQPVQQSKDQNSSCPVDRQPGAVQCTAVYKSTVTHKVHAHLPQPSEKGQPQEQDNQRPYRVMAHIIQRLYQFSSVFFRDRIKPYRIRLPLCVIDQLIDLHHLSLTPFILSVLFPAQKDHSEIPCQESPPACQPILFFRRIFHY